MFLIIGTVTADLLVQSDTPLAALGGDGFRNSNLIFTEEPLTISMGGNGGNSAYVLAGLGAPTALASAAGQDLLGDALVELLAARNVNLDGLLRSAAHATSTSTIVMTDPENQVVFHHLGATTAARFESIPAALLDETQALLASSFPIMPQLRAGGFAEALSHVQARGGITALDVGPAIGEPATLGELRPLLPSVDYLIANTHELALLVGEDSWEAAAQAVLAAGARSLIVKQGAAGATAWTAGERVHVPGFSVAANISVGAGDSFNAGLLCALQQGRTLAQALEVGNAVAALVVASPQGVLDAPTLAQAEALIHDRA